jgi:hypothetical protein
MKIQWQERVPAVWLLLAVRDGKLLVDREAELDRVQDPLRKERR